MNIPTRNMEPPDDGAETLEALELEAEENLKDCPWCKSGNDMMVESAPRVIEYFALCQKCQARGPVMPTFMEAAAAWDKRD